MTAPDLDALIERLQGAASKARIMDVFTRDANGNPMKDHGTSWPLVIVGKDLIEQAAAALVQLREENALMGHPPAQIQKLERRAERAEAELDTQNRALAQCRALLKQEIDDVVPLRDKVAALEAERDALLAENEVCRAEVAAMRTMLNTARTLAAATLNAALRWNDHNYDNDTPNRWAKESADKAGFPRTSEGDAAAVQWLETVDAAIDAARKEKP